MEKLRSDKLRYCGIMIQKHVKGWLYRYRTLLCRIRIRVKGTVPMCQMLAVELRYCVIMIQKHAKGWHYRYNIV
jgi:IQ calmodulin-binding motif